MYSAMKAEMERQITLLNEEQFRVKDFINQNNFDCTTAPYVLAAEYRTKLKNHIRVLTENLKDL